MPSQPSTIDFVAPFDPTGYTGISGAQLFQLVSGLSPYTDIGLTLVTTDVAGVPTVPNASTTTKWQNYIWIRVAATQVVPYVWNPTAASDATYLQWQTVAASSIGIGTIVDSMIADNTITDIKIANLSYSKLIGAPTGLPPSGAAGGDLSGTYPNPVVANGVITGAKMANNTVAHIQLAAQAVQVPTDILPSGTGLTHIRTNAGATAAEWCSGNIQQIVYAELTTLVSSSGNIASLTAIPNANTTGVTDSTLSLAITPLSASSVLLIEVTVPLNVPVGSGFVGIFTANSGASAAIAGVGLKVGGAGDTVATPLHIVHKLSSASTSARTYYVMFGCSASTSYVNSIDGTNVFFGLAKATIKITEYL